jgi:hypothetical protein
MSLKSKLLNKNLKQKNVRVDGDTVKVRELTGTERIKLGDMDEDVKERFRYVFLNAVDLGEPVSKDEFEKMFDVDFESVSTLVREVLDLSGLTDKSAGELEKN